MANYVTNIVHFDGDPERILDLRGAVQDDQYEHADSGRLGGSEAHPAR